MHDAKHRDGVVSIDETINDDVGGYDAYADIRTESGPARTNRWMGGEDVVVSRWNDEDPRRLIPKRGEPDSVARAMFFKCQEFAAFGLGQGFVHEGFSPDQIIAFLGDALVDELPHGVFHRGKVAAGDMDVQPRPLLGSEGDQHGTDLSRHRVLLNQSSQNNAMSARSWTQGSESSTIAP
jgi:hypothetical protein